MSSMKRLVLSFAALGPLACAVSADPAPARRIDDQVLRDPDALRARTGHLRRQVLIQTRDLDDERWRQLRPSIARDLVGRGLTPGDAEAILISVDTARRR